MVIAKRTHPFPSRTRQLSSSAPMVLQVKLWESRTSPGLFYFRTDRDVEQAKCRTTSDMTDPGRMSGTALRHRLCWPRSGCRLLFAALAKTSLARGRRQSARKCFRTDRDVEQAQRRTTSDVTDPGPQVWGYLAALPTVGRCSALSGFDPSTRQ